jgi:hypothetical protein
MTNHARIIAALAIASFAAPARADGDAPRTIPVIQQLYDCRTITEPQARLACYDRQVAAVHTAEERRDIRIVDREAVREARRGLFGFSLGNIRLFGGRDGDEAQERAESEEVTQIESTITQMTRDGAGRFVFALANGQRWYQAEASGGRSPRVGQAIVIRRGTLGSYLANIDGRPAIRVMRQQ